MSDLSTIVRGTPSYVAGNAKFGAGGLSGAVLGAAQADYFLSATGADGGQITTGTIEAWVKHAATTAIRVAFAHPGWYWVGCDASGNATARYGTPASEVSLTSTKQIADGAWHHVAIVFSAGAASLYVDGSRVSTSATVKSTANDSGGVKFYLGGINEATTIYDWQGSLDEVRISNTARYAGTTYSIPAAEFTTDGNTADLWHLDGSGADSAISIAPNDANILYSPYNWNLTSARARTINAGAYLRATLMGSASAIAAKFDISTDLAPLPQISYRVDHGPWTSVPIAGTVNLAIPAGNTWPTHTVELVVKSTTETQNRWNSPQNTAVSFLGFAVTPVTVATRTTRPRKLYVLAYGDSITEGVRTLNMNAANDTDRNDSTVGWAYPLGQLLGAEVGVVGFGATGVTVGGSGNVPALTSSYGQQWSGQARSITNPQAPDIILINIGTNDPAGTDITTAMTGLLNNLLSKTPATTRIGVIYPWRGDHAAQLAAAVAACTSASRVKVIDTTGWWSSTDSSDGLHPYGYINTSDLAPRIATEARKILNGGGMYLNVAGAATAVANVRK